MSQETLPADALILCFTISSPLSLTRQAKQREGVILYSSQKHCTICNSIRNFGNRVPGSRDGSTVLINEYKAFERLGRYAHSCHSALHMSSWYD